MKNKKIILISIFACTLFFFGKNSLVFAELTDSECQMRWGGKCQRQQCDSADAYIDDCTTQGYCCRLTVAPSVNTCNVPCSGVGQHYAAVCDLTKEIGVVACASVPGKEYCCSPQSAATPTTDPCKATFSTGNACTLSAPVGGSTAGTCLEDQCVPLGSSVTNPSGGPIVPTDTNLPTNPDLVKGVLVNVANWLLDIIGIIAIIGFIISGIQYFLVSVDEKSAEKAKKTMTASIVGLIIALSGYIAIYTIETMLSARL